MTEKTQSQLEGLGFKKTGILYVGKVNGVFFYADDKQDGDDKILLHLSLAENDSKSTLFAFLDECQKTQDVASYEYHNEKLEIVYVETETNSIRTFVEKLSQVFNEINGKNVCDCCDKKDFLNIYTNHSASLLLCPECAQRTLNSLEEDRNRKPRYVRAFLGSLCGALIGSIVWILLGAINFYASIAGLAIASGAFKGYEKAKGKVSTVGVILNIIAILLAFIFAEYVGIYIDLKKEISDITFFVYLISTPSIFSLAEIWLDLLPSIGMGLLFAFLGTYRTIIQYFKQAKSTENFTIEKVEFANE